MKLRGTPKVPEFTTSENEVYIRLQAGIMALMLSRKTIKDPEDYSKRIAPLFEAIINGEIYYADETKVGQQTEEWKEKVKALMQS